MTSSLLCPFALFIFLAITSANASDRRTSRQGTPDVCPSVQKCLDAIDANSTCTTLPLPPNSFISPPSRPSFNLTKIRRGVWVYDDGAYNSLFLKHANRLAVLDFVDSSNSNTPNGTRTLLTDAAELILNGTTPHRVDLVYSHAHYDHIGASTRFYNYITNTYPSAKIFIWGTKESRDLIRRSRSKRAVEPNVLVGKRGRTLSLSPRLQVRMDIVGGHTQSDLRLFIPRYKREKGIVMYVDVVFPGYVPPFNLALTEDVGFYIKAQEDLLSMHFDILVPGHVRPGNKSDVRRNLEYTKDLLDAARAGLVSTTNERLNNAGISKYTDPNAVEFGNYMFAFAILRKLQLDTCYRIMLEKWGCRLGGVDFSTRGHCLTAINYVTLEL